MERKMYMQKSIAAIVLILSVLAVSGCAEQEETRVKDLVIELPDQEKTEIRKTGEE